MMWKNHVKIPLRIFLFLFGRGLQVSSFYFFNLLPRKLRGLFENVLRKFEDDRRITVQTQYHKQTLRIVTTTNTWVLVISNFRFCIN